MNNPLIALITPLVTIVAIVVLIALDKITGNVGLPIIVAIAGVHVGAALNNPTVVTVPPPTAPRAPIAPAQIP